MAPASPVIALRGVSKDYRGLRPLRIQELEIREGQAVAILGFDQTTAEVLVSLITGAITPDSGDVMVFGQSTRDIVDADAWLQGLDHFGILSERAVLLDQLTAEQNLAVPFSLELDDITADLRGRVRRLAEEVGLDENDLQKGVGALSPAARQRVRLGRALALQPRVLLAEHPSASLNGEGVPEFAADLSAVVSSRSLTSVVLTADRTFAGAVAPVVLELNAATGELKPSARWRRWFS
jgi:predicted ABC-type transport system involved in lysophospholipase L1 biosynthesis ATPase subunit